MEEPPREPLKPDAPAVMTSRFEPKDTAAAYSALDSLGKIPGARVLGGTVELNGLRPRGQQGCQLFHHAVEIGRGERHVTADPQGEKICLGTQAVEFHRPAQHSCCGYLSQAVER